MALYPDTVRIFPGYPPGDRRLPTHASLEAAIGRLGGPTTAIGRSIDCDWRRNCRPLSGVCYPCLSRRRQKSNPRSSCLPRREGIEQSPMPLPCSRVAQYGEQAAIACLERGVDGLIRAATEMRRNPYPAPLELSLVDCMAILAKAVVCRITLSRVLEDNSSIVSARRGCSAHAQRRPDLRGDLRGTAAFLPV